MKTAISISDDLLHQADATARQLGLSRSRFVALAVTDFLARQRNREMLEKLNAVYAGAPQIAEKQLLAGMKAKVRTVIKDRW